MVVSIPVSLRAITMLATIVSVTDVLPVYTDASTIVRPMVVSIVLTLRVMNVRYMLSAD